MSSYVAGSGSIHQNISLRQWVGQKIDDADQIKVLRRCLPMVDEIKSNTDWVVILKSHVTYLMDADISTQLSFFRIVSYICLPRGSKEGQDGDN